MIFGTQCCSHRWEATHGHADLPRKHSAVHRWRQESFQAGTAMFVQTVFWQASVQASVADIPQTVTHVFGTGSFDNPPMRLDNLSEVHTLSQTKLGSVPIPSNLSLWLSFCLALLLLVKRPLRSTAGTANPAAHQAWTIR